MDPLTNQLKDHESPFKNVPTKVAPEAEALRATQKQQSDQQKVDITQQQQVMSKIAQAAAAMPQMTKRPGSKVGMRSARKTYPKR
jgi:hypothetical protein